MLNKDEKKPETKTSPTLDLPGYNTVPDADETQVVEVLSEPKTPKRDPRMCTLCSLDGLEVAENKSPTHALYRCARCGRSWGFRRSELESFLRNTLRTQPTTK